MTQPSELGLVYRPASPDEMSFILDSWLKSYKFSPWAGVMENHKYFVQQREAIEALLARGSQITVAEVPDTDRVAGWICHEHKPGIDVVHYVYVKDPWRKMGIGGALVDETCREREILYTFRTRASKYILPGAIFAPEIARRKCL
jgi:GNAT superfamily N-acetyltransferase